MFKNNKIILASKSPRRQELLKGMGFDFEVKTKDVDEVYPENLIREEIPLFLCKLKANAFSQELNDNYTIVITADTIVWLNNEVLHKPKDFDDAIAILEKLSGNMHEVITGVCIQSLTKTIIFYDESKVWFKKLTKEEIYYYVTNFKPYDKAGGYGIQEWIGYVAIEKIEGSFYNVMGLPTLRLFEELRKL